MGVKVDFLGAKVGYVIFDETEHISRMDNIRAASRDALVDALWCSYDCTRAWSAWNVGTMGASDFKEINEDEDRIREISEMAFGAAMAYIQELKEENDRLWLKILKGEGSDS